jgi:hypothetical protein
LTPRAGSVAERGRRSASHSLLSLRFVSFGSGWQPRASTVLWNKQLILRWYFLYWARARDETIGVLRETILANSRRNPETVSAY